MSNRKKLRKKKAAPGRLTIPHGLTRLELDIKVTEIMQKQMEACPGEFFEAYIHHDDDCPACDLNAPDMSSICKCDELPVSIERKAYFGKMHS